MSTSVRKELLWKFEKTEDPEIMARDQEILEVLLAARPQVMARLVAEGRLIEARTALRRVLARRQLELSPEDDAHIEACGDLATIERWHDRAVTATSASEALQ
ncbi:hypothetical protein WME99_45250 [Sorangium sp. So ce136]|uniref:hypothetical protein n=1 Tax=Sorangium sp. So ce136 TaxID=3133284 RepID=UPI003EFF99D1